MSKEDKSIWKKGLDNLVFIPNLPFALIMVLYLLIKIMSNNSLVDIAMIKEGDIANRQEIRDYIDKVYPKKARITIAIVFYACIIIHFIK